MQLIEGWTLISRGMDENNGYTTDNEKLPTSGSPVPCSCPRDHRTFAH